MKLTLNIDGDLLSRVVELTGSKTKTGAISFALKEVERRSQLTAALEKGTEASEAELKMMFDPVSDPLKMRVAEGSLSYGNPKK